ncbi:MAG: cyclic nucleotide-binding domain-containing protein [Coriobacteriia bacterium]|nr:cyclic nucleotide-binding domain-containing protein [Coriobacteriia bacterium]
MCGANGGLVKSFSDGECIFAQGSRPTHVYLIQSGVVRLSRDEDGEDVTTGFLCRGSVLGETDLLEGARRRFSAWALGETRLLAVSAEEIAHNADDPLLREVLLRRAP